MLRAAVTICLGLAAVPAQALAQPVSGPFFPEPAEEYGPGITVSGVAFARVSAPATPTEESVRDAVDSARPRAVMRAISDARRRAEAIAGAVGVSLGRVDAMEFEQGFEREPCRRSRRTQRVRCVVPGFVAASTTVTFEIAGGPGSSDGARELSSFGTGSVAVDAPERTSPAIRHSLFAARRTATPEAARAARANVELAARAAGVQLGPLFSIVEQTSPYGYTPLLGGFAPGRFCGVVRRSIVRRDPETGSQRVVGRKRVRRCYAPSTVQVRVEAKYLAAD